MHFADLSVLVIFDINLEKLPEKKKNGEISQAYSTTVQYPISTVIPERHEENKKKMRKSNNENRFNINS
jgi:hypothetical protein